MGRSTLGEGDGNDGENDLESAAEERGMEVERAPIWIR